MRLKIAWFLYLLVLMSCGNRYKASSSSMEKTIMTGERFYVSKTENFRNNDIVAFDYYGPNYQAIPDETGQWPLYWEKRVFRLVASSGDVLLIKEGDVFVNDKPVFLPPKAMMEYEVVSNEQLEEFESKNEILPTVTKNAQGNFEYLVALTMEEVQQYKQKKEVIRVRKKNRDKSFENICPFDSCQWTIDNFGPLSIPEVGSTITVDTFSIKLFHNIEGIQIGKNIIKEKLYFVMGDNRHMAEDSRYIGFISQSKMVGVVK